MLRRTGRWLSWLALPLAAAIGLLLAFCSFYGVWSRDEWIVYGAMDAECHPAWRDYYWSTVKAGDNVDAVIALTNPSVVKRDGNRVTLEYYQNYDPNRGGPYLTGLLAEARDGRMVSAYAYSCVWTRQFFDVHGQEDLYFVFRYRRLPQGGAISILHGY